MSVYRVTEIIGTSPTSWEDAAKQALAAASGSLRDLRVAEVIELDITLDKEGSGGVLPQSPEGQLQSTKAPDTGPRSGREKRLENCADRTGPWRILVQALRRCFRTALMGFLVPSGWGKSDENRNSFRAAIANDRAGVLCGEGGETDRATNELRRWKR